MVDYSAALPQQQNFQAPDLMQNAMRMQQMQTQNAQVESANQLRAMQTRGLAQDQQLTALKMQSTRQEMAAAAAARARATADQNALLGAIRGSVVGDNGPQMPDLTTAANRLAAVGNLGPAATALGAVNAFTDTEKKKMDLSKINSEVVDKDLATFRTFAPTVRTPEDAGLFAAAMFDHPSIGKLMSHMGLSREQAIAKAEQDFETDPQRWTASQIGLSGPQVVDTLKQKQTQTDLGGKISTQTEDAFGRPIGEPTVQAKTPTTAEIARGGLAEIPKLRPGERYNPETRTVEAIPGSDLYVSQAVKHEKDLKAVKGIERKTQEAIKNIDSILSPENEKGLAQHFGGFGAYATQFGGGKTADVGNLINQFKSSLKSAGLEEFRTGGSIGAMTEREWPIVEAEIASLSPKMSLSAAKAAMRRVQSRLDAMREDARGTYSDTWQRTQFYKPQANKAAAGESAASGEINVDDLLKLYPGPK